MKTWPEELSYRDLYFPIIMNDWMDWEDINDMINLINEWIINDKPDITLEDVVLIHEMLGIS